MVNMVAKLHLTDFSQTRWQIFSYPVVIIMILSITILPLPHFIALDLFVLIFNIVLSIMILLVAMFTLCTLDFTTFPAVLLFSTPLWLVLNVTLALVILIAKA